MQWPQWIGNEDLLKVCERDWKRRCSQGLHAKLPSYAPGKTVSSLVSRGQSFTQRIGCWRLVDVKENIPLKLYWLWTLKRPYAAHGAEVGSTTNHYWLCTLKKNFSLAYNVSAMQAAMELPKYFWSWRSVNGKTEKRPESNRDSALWTSGSCNCSDAPLSSMNWQVFLWSRPAPVKPLLIIGWQWNSSDLRNELKGLAQ